MEPSGKKKKSYKNLIEQKCDYSLHYFCLNIFSLHVSKMLVMYLECYTLI